MRIIAGAARGRRLAVPRDAAVRPTADRVREALFSSLQPRLAGARVLDLFAGTGALGLEALSRGADRVTFVEHSRRAVSSLRANIETVGLPGTEVVARDVRAALADELPAAPFDLVLLDPPYALADPDLASLLSAVVGHLADDALVVVERAARSGPPPWPPVLLADSPRRYGDTALHRASGGSTTKETA